MLANAVPFWSSASFFAAEVCPLKNVVQLVMIAADPPVFVLGALVDVAAVEVLGVVVVVMLALGGVEDPHAASRIDARAIPPSVTPIRELSKRPCFSVSPVNLMVMIIAARSLPATESMRKSVEATSGPFRRQRRLSPDIARTPDRYTRSRSNSDRRHESAARTVTQNSVNSRCSSVLLQRPFQP
jgi:hypothetical protein